MAINIPLGSHFQDGVRMGPYYTTQFSETSIADLNGILTSNNYNTYGPGILASPDFTWSFTPAAPGDGFTTENNLVGVTNAAALTSAGNLTLLGDQSVTFTNAGVAQFDWPRIVTVTIAGAAAPAGTEVTIFGFDWWGFPLQHTYIVEDEGTYPEITYGGAGNGGLSVPAKAFYSVNRVYVDRALSPAVGCTISLGAADVFGLPYVTKPVGIANVNAIGWGNTSDLKSHVADASLTVLGVYRGADAAVPSNITGDVRGLYGPSSAADGIKKLKFRYYLEGADVWQNQVANMQELYMTASGSQTPQGVPVPPLSPSDLYGVAQFYTGKP